MGPPHAMHLSVCELPLRACAEAVSYPHIFLPIHRKQALQVHYHLCTRLRNPVECNVLHWWTTLFHEALISSKHLLFLIYLNIPDFESVFGRELQRSPTWFLWLIVKSWLMFQIARFLLASAAAYTKSCCIRSAVVQNLSIDDSCSTFGSCNVRPTRG